MKPEPRRSTAAAIWLLQKLGGRACEDALIGDLLEKVSEGQTFNWLWREVVVALVASTWKEIQARWRDLGLAAFVTTIFLWVGSEPWEWHWLDFVWTWAGEHGDHWMLYLAYSYAVRATYLLVLVLLGLFVIFMCGRTLAWRKIVRAIPVSYMLFVLFQIVVELIGLPASSYFWDVRHILDGGCAAAIVFLALLIPLWMSPRPVSTSVA